MAKGRRKRKKNSDWDHWRYSGQTDDPTGLTIDEAAQLDCQFAQEIVEHCATVEGCTPEKIRVRLENPSNPCNILLVEEGWFGTTGRVLWLQLSHGVVVAALLVEEREDQEGWSDFVADEQGWDTMRTFVLPQTKVRFHGAMARVADIFTGGAPLAYETTYAREVPSWLGDKPARAANSAADLSRVGDEALLTEAVSSTLPELALMNPAEIRRVKRRLLK